MPRRILQGSVVSDKCDKSVVVMVKRRVMHPMYKKFITRTQKFMAHDVDNKYKTGDKVSIRECRPLSKKKRWEIFLSADDKSADAKSTDAKS